MTPPDTISGHKARTYPIRIRDRILTLLGPADPDALLDDPRTEKRFYAEDGHMPYWARPWPAAVMLAEMVVQEFPGPGPALEIGCGLGIAGLAAAMAGWHVTITDYEPDALAFVQATAELNGLKSVRVERLDWRNFQHPGSFDLILASDVLFEERWVDPVAEFLARNLRRARALVADPDRRTALGFAPAVHARRLGVRRHPVMTSQPDGVTVRGTIYEVTMGHLLSAGHDPSQYA